MGETRLKIGGLFEEIFVIEDGIPKFKMFVDGGWNFGAKREFQPTYSPIDGNLIAYVSKGSEEDAEKAVESTAANQREIRDIAAIERIHILHDAISLMEENFDYFVDTLVIDASKPRHGAEGEVRATMERMRMTLEEALNITRRSPYGLDACVFTNDFYRMWRVAKLLQVGEVTVNDMPRHGVGFFPFGGVKESGIGYSIDEMTVLKTIVFNLEPAKMGKVKRVPRM